VISAALQGALDRSRGSGASPGAEAVNRSITDEGRQGSSRQLAPRLGDIQDRVEALPLRAVQEVMVTDLKVGSETVPRFNLSGDRQDGNADPPRSARTTSLRGPRRFAHHVQ
jgi:hypothetical protein